MGHGGVRTAPGSGLTSWSDDSCHEQARDTTEGVGFGRAGEGFVDEFELFIRHHVELLSKL